MTNNKVPKEEKTRNLEFYKRRWIDGEDLYALLKEYEISYPRAFQIKKTVEEKYSAEIAQLRG